MSDLKRLLSDSEIVNLLGLELQGGIQNIEALYRVRRFQDNFETALEEGLEKRTLDILKETTQKNVADAVDCKVDLKV